MVSKNQIYFLTKDKLEAAKIGDILRRGRLKSGEKFLIVKNGVFSYCIYVASNPEHYDDEYMIKNKLTKKLGLASLKYATDAPDEILSRYTEELSSGGK